MILCRRPCSVPVSGSLQLSSVCLSIYNTTEKDKSQIVQAIFFASRLQCLPATFLFDVQCLPDELLQFLGIGRGGEDGAVILRCIFHRLAVTLTGNGNDGSLQKY